MRKKLFTTEQEEFILNNYKQMSNYEIAQKLGFRREQVGAWLQHRGIKRNGLGCHPNNIVFSKNDIEFIKNNYEFMTSAEIAKILGYTKYQIQGKIQKLNLPKKKRKINSLYFNNIDTPLKAYFLGFIYADGWVVYNEDCGHYELGIQLQSQDKYVLERLNEQLGNLNIIYHNSSKDIYINEDKIIHSGCSDTLRVYSKRIVCDLIRHGVVPNKTCCSTIPVVNDELFFDFLRGYIDGDGCYYVDNKHTYMHITCAQIKPLEYIQSKLHGFNINTHIYSENCNKHRLMCINSVEMNKLINHLYYQDGLFYLTRKYEKIKHLLGFAA